jgi:AbrB family looped-hinge helix DNA binding protein
MHLIKISPKGQITIPKELRDMYPNKTLGLTVVNNQIILSPIKFTVVQEDGSDLERLAEKSFAFWDNSEDDIYQEFYEKR